MAIYIGSQSEYSHTRNPFCLLKRRIEAYNVSSITYTAVSDTLLSECF